MTLPHSNWPNQYVSLPQLKSNPCHFRSQILKPNATTQEEMLVNALSEILFKAADGKDAFVCMLGSDNCFDSNSHFGIDGYTEKVFLNGPIPASFSIYFRLFNTLQFKLKLKKHRWCAWDLNPGRQDGRRKRIHWATAAPQRFYTEKVLPFKS